MWKRAKKERKKSQLVMQQRCQQNTRKRCPTTKVLQRERWR